MEEKIESLNLKIKNIDSIKINNDKLKQDLKNKDEAILRKDKELTGLQEKISKVLSDLKKLESENENLKKMKQNNNNNEKLKKMLMEKEKEIKEKEIGLKNREIKIKKKEEEINERILFIEDMEKILESQQNKIDSDKKALSDKYQNLQNEINNLNVQKIELENQMKGLHQQKNNLNQNQNNMNIMNPNLMNFPMNNSNLNMINNNPNFNILNNMNNMFMNNINNMNNYTNNFLFNNNNNLINNNSNNLINNNNNNNKNLKKFKPPKPISLYSKPTLIGLQNIGATCFMNATLQCLSQTEDLTNYFLDEKRSSDKIKNNNIAMSNSNLPQLTPVYLELVKNLWDKNNPNGYYEPRNFMKTIEIMNPLFKLGQPGDSKDFIIFLLEQFHNELKKSLINNNKENNDSDQVNQYDQKNSFISFFQNFKKQTSIISDIFFGIQENTNICLFCKNNYSSKGKLYPICYNYQIFNSFIFPLEEIRKMKNENNKINNMNIGINTNEVSLEDCFIYNQKTELFNGENKNFCNICKQLCDSLYTSKIYSCPNVLVLIINRGKNNMYNVKLNFEETIDITKYVSLKEGQVVYNLTGVITHYGESGPNAHFMAFCKSPINNNWYRYNDAFVTDVKDVKKDIIDFGNPYILFYKKVN